LRKDGIVNDAIFLLTYFATQALANKDPKQTFTTNLSNHISFPLSKISSVKIFILSSSPAA
jgi:hypothetical protein